MTGIGHILSADIIGKIPMDKIQRRGKVGFLLFAHPDSFEIAFDMRQLREITCQQCGRRPEIPVQAVKLRLHRSPQRFLAQPVEILRRHIDSLSQYIRGSILELTGKSRSRNGHQVSRTDHNRDRKLRHPSVAGDGAADFGNNPPIKQLF